MNKPKLIDLQEREALKQATVAICIFNSKNYTIEFANDFYLQIFKKGKKYERKSNNMENFKQKTTKEREKVEQKSRHFFFFCSHLFFFRRARRCSRRKLKRWEGKKVDAPERQL